MLECPIAGACQCADDLAILLDECRVRVGHSRFGQAAAIVRRTAGGASVSLDAGGGEGLPISPDDPLLAKLRLFGPA